ncbi:MAG: hypothetical protein R3C19_09710 [Planctomycetaceae bacterium]
MSLQTRCAPAWNPERRVWQMWLITSTTVPGLAGTTYAESEDGITLDEAVTRSAGKCPGTGQQLHFRRAG